MYTGPTGTIEGRVRVEGPRAPQMQGKGYSRCPEAEAMYGSLFREGAVGEGRGLADVVVAVTGYKGFVPELREARRIVFERCSFGSRTVTMTFGQRLEVVNRSRLMVGPSLLQAPSPALLIAPPEEHGDPVKLYPPHPGYFTLADRMGSDFLWVDVYALLHPLHTVSDEAGRFRISGVPVGRVQVHGRLAALETEATEEVNVTEGAMSEVALTLVYRPLDAGLFDAGQARRDGPRPIP